MIQTPQKFSEPCSTISNIYYSVKPQLLQHGVMSWWEGGKGCIEGGTEGRRNWEGGGEILEKGNNVTVIVSIV